MAPVAPTHVLIVEDEPAHAAAIRLALEREMPGVSVEVASTIGEFHKVVPAVQPDIVLMDLNLPDGRAIDVLTEHGAELGFPVLVMTSYGNETTAVEAMKAGALDYIVKSAETFRDMPRTLGRALREWEAVQARRQAEQALRESERRFETLTQLSPVGVFRTDPKGATTFVNPKWCELAGMSSGDAMGDGWLQAVHPDDRERIAQGWHRASPDERVSATEYRFLRPDGSVAWVMGQVAEDTDLAGRIIGYVGTITDITERRLAHEASERAELRLRETQRIEAIGRLAGGVAHDFNNLLQAMVATVQSLRLRSTDAQVVRSAQELEKHVKRGASLTKQLLLFSRRQQPKTEALDLNELVREAATMLRRLIPENIRFATEFARGELVVDGDRSQLDQVLMNLVVNARDAMPDGGQLLVRTGAMVQGQVSIEVVDSGTGIAAEVREHLFEPFFTTKAVGQGTGLGLAVVHGIVGQHGGHVEVESEPGHGSTFRVVLPLRATRPEAASPEDEVGTFPGGRGERVLVVEDEEGAREGLQEILEILGYKPTVVASAEEALLLPDERPFDLVLSDLMLPGMSGGRLATSLLVRWPATRFILMSGYLEDGRVRHEVPPAVRFLQKPFDIEVLGREIRAALEAPAS